MKSLIFCLMAVFVFGSCSTNPNNNGGTTTTIVPNAPNTLIGSVLSTSSVSLSWVDNSTNEDGFKIERRLNGALQFVVVGSVNSNITGFVDTALLSNTSYEYRVYAFNAVGNSLSYSNVIVLTTLQASLPVVTTAAISAITDSTAFSGGEITDDGGANIIARGVVWSTSDTPTVALNTKTIDGNGSGIFSSNISGLVDNTTYYVRAYATNANGTSYGNQEHFTTTSTIVLPSVTICNQIWTSQNLSVSRYRNGDTIPQVTTGQWAGLTTGAWCWYNNDSANYWQYGKLYNWYAVNDARGLAPLGWHVPTDAEWNILAKCLDFNADTLCQGCSQSSIAGGAMKTAFGWSSPNIGATNSCGFSALPGGQRTVSFYGINDEGYWWTSTPSASSEAYNRSLNYANSNLGKDSPHAKMNGLSVRLIKD